MILTTLLSADNVRLYSCALVGPRQNPNDPPQVGRASLVFSGVLRISAPEGKEMAYLKIGSLSLPLLMRTRIWRVENTLIFSQPTPGRFWSLEIPYGRIDIILSHVCNLQPKPDVSEPVEDEADPYIRGPSAAVRDAMEMCRKRTPSSGSLYTEEPEGPYPRRRASLKLSESRRRALEKEVPLPDPDEFDFFPTKLAKDVDTTRFEDPEELDASSITANTTKFSYLDSDSDEEVRSVVLSPAMHQGSTPILTHQSITSTPPRSHCLEQPFTPSRSSSLGPHSSPGVHRSPSPFKLPSKPESTKVPVPLSPRLRHDKLQMGLRINPTGYQSNYQSNFQPGPFEFHMDEALDDILMASNPQSSPSEDSFGPNSPDGLMKNPVFIATPTQSFSNMELTDELFAPDHSLVSDACDTQHLLRHPLTPLYRRDSSQPALRSKDLVRVGPHASGSNISTVGEYISWQMINRICGTSLCDSNIGCTTPPDIR